MTSSGETKTKTLEVETKRHRRTAEVLMRGALTEHTDLSAIACPDAPTLVLELGGVERLNSVGVQKWVRFLRRLCSRYERVVLERCPTPLVQQFNMIPATHRGAEVKSVMLPYYCEACGHFEERPLEIGPDTLPEIEPERSCTACEETMIFDDLPEQYLAFLR